MHNKIISAGNAFRVLRGYNDVTALGGYRDDLLYHGGELVFYVQCIELGDMVLAYLERENSVSEANHCKAIICRYGD